MKLYLTTGNSSAITEVKTDQNYSIITYYKLHYKQLYQEYKKRQKRQLTRNTSQLCMLYVHFFTRLIKKEQRVAI